LEERKGIKKGERITCIMCGVEIYEALKDIPYGSDLRSDSLKYVDGEPLEERAVKACPNCMLRFRSISTTTRRTII
jgi:hypothetical protein